MSFSIAHQQQMGFGCGNFNIINHNQLKQLVCGCDDLII
jgi:hypothetical protein